MTKPLIKICGIRDPAMAKAAAFAGADLIGMIFHPSSPRYVNVTQATKIADATIKAGSLPVAVFVDQTDSEMRQICEISNIKIVQLHGSIARAHHHLLPNDFQRLYVPTIPHVKSDKELHSLRTDRDFILIDHTNPGQGNTLNWAALHYDLPFRWLLAGGLTSSNVAHAIHLLKPDGVDVSSGVESAQGNKDILLIQQFITSVRDFTYDK